MNSNRLILPLLCLLCLLGTSSLLSAQVVATGDSDQALQRAEMVVQRMTERFGLSEDQQAVLLEKQTELQREMSALRASGASESERQENMRQLNERRRAILDEVLTEEQKATIQPGSREIRRSQMPADRKPQRTTEPIGQPE